MGRGLGGLVRVLPFLIPFVVVACTGGDTANPSSAPLADPTVDFGIAPPNVDTDWPETDTDTDADTDSDTDTDTDTDVVDTDTDVVDTDTGVVDTDTGIVDTDTDTAPPCELTWLVEVRDGATICGTTECTAAEAISVVAIAKNTCTADLTAPGTTDCFAQDYTVEEATTPTADTRTPTPCTGTPVTVTAGQQVEQPLVFEAMIAADYVGKVTFQDTAHTVVSSTFTVVP